MFVTVRSKRQVTFPARVLDAPVVDPGDRVELLPSPEGFLLCAQRVEASRLAPLRGWRGCTSRPGCRRWRATTCSSVRPCVRPFESDGRR
ncbi:MAG TPA: AbrB/MazE/SpoVT family DNA-binding domain-containing protein [Rubrivivax sp.]|jgi:hypothetical protein|nr:AbrB/MazE/SpoVT family DNA-binding domain-containing protein [Rhodoferax sp.]MCL4738568.1 AbrB/MazE/SpoVT family DNA-binding domain-containing protein [Burkholderiaceae bacterium]HMR70619.1 AbrB/MazE/SpoVT family DNA-binding domain-containing protein [Rubrivivax sp.]